MEALWEWAWNWSPGRAACSVGEIGLGKVRICVVWCVVRGAVAVAVRIGSRYFTCGSGSRLSCIKAVGGT